MVRGIRGSQQHAVEVNTVVIDPVLHSWEEAQELHAADSLDQLHALSTRVWQEAISFIPVTSLASDMSSGTPRNIGTDS